MSKIKNITAREILNSKGEPTVEAKIILSNGLTAKAAVPCGTSTSSFEACDLRDDDSTRFSGRGVLKAVSQVNEVIAPKLLGLKINDQALIDKTLIDLDATPTKKNLGANAILAVSLAAARAAAQDAGEELFYYLAKTHDFPEPKKMPTPLFNIFNGGAHADTGLDFQEFMIIPSLTGIFIKTEMNNKPARPTKRLIQAGAEIFKALGKILKESGFSTEVGLEGGYAPDMDSSIQALEFIMAAIISAGYEPGRDVNLGLDIGSSVLFDRGAKKYVFRLDNALFTNDNLIGLYNEWLKKFPIIYLEDGLDEDEWAAWSELTSELGNKLMIVGDDLFATNLDRLRRGLQEKAANSIIIKPNQIGTLSETIACVKLAQRHNYKVIVSHRSGETNDDFIADLAVAVGADYLKAGSLSRGERVAKYNRLMEIEDLILA
ncbi:MAG: phosphopyruvate hydratase [Candidatus Falkowbacteria bacterium]|nr:phosphopyruvate hydratase [Candidatus Falkowbacteria bacterium]